MIEIVGASSALQNCLLFVVLLVFFYFLARLYTPNERDLYYIACGHIFLTEAATDSPAKLISFLSYRDLKLHTNMGISWMDDLAVSITIMKWLQKI